MMAPYIPGRRPDSPYTISVEISQDRAQVDALVLRAEADELIIKWTLTLIYNSPEH